MSVVVHDNSVELLGESSTGDLRVKLPRLEAPQALEELKELLFTMADNLAQHNTECTKFFHSFLTVEFMHLKSDFKIRANCFVISPRCISIRQSHEKSPKMACRCVFKGLKNSKL